MASDGSGTTGRYRPARQARVPTRRPIGRAVPAGSLLTGEILAFLSKGSGSVTPPLYVACRQAPTPVRRLSSIDSAGPEGTNKASWSDRRFPAAGRAWPTTLQARTGGGGGGPGAEHRIFATSRTLGTQHHPWRPEPEEHRTTRDALCIKNTTAPEPDAHSTTHGALNLRNTAPFVTL